MDTLLKAIPLNEISFKPITLKTIPLKKVMGINT